MEAGQLLDESGQGVEESVHVLCTRQLFLDLRQDTLNTSIAAALPRLRRALRRTRSSWLAFNVLADHLILKCPLVEQN